jgi:hypothetical protein
MKVTRRNSQNSPRSRLGRWMVKMRLPSRNKKRSRGNSKS